MTTVDSEAWRVVWFVKKDKKVLYKDFRLVDEWQADLWTNDMLFRNFPAKIFKVPISESDFVQGHHEINQDFSTYKNQPEIEAENIVKSVLENTPKN